MTCALSFGAFISLLVSPASHLSSVLSLFLNPLGESLHFVGVHTENKLIVRRCKVRKDGRAGRLARDKEETKSTGEAPEVNKRGEKKDA